MLCRWPALRSSWHALKDKTGWYPVIHRNEHRQLETLALDAADPHEVLAAAAAIDPERWFRDRAAEVAPDSDDDDGSEPKGPPRKPGDKAEPATRFVVPFDSVDGSTPVPDVFILLVPTTKGYEVPAYVPFGGWNECPNDEVHVAILRSWFHRYGAELAAMSGDELELAVARPPTTDDAAERLALDQFRYCEDIVFQFADVESIDALASSLKGSHIWFFWWD